MTTHLKIRVTKPRARKTQEAGEELVYLMTFNRSISQAMARTMQDISEAIFLVSPDESQGYLGFCTVATAVEISFRTR